jgi:hypothetical protein
MSLFSWDEDEIMRRNVGSYTLQASCGLYVKFALSDCKKESVLRLSHCCSLLKYINARAEVPGGVDHDNQIFVGTMTYGDQMKTPE